MGFNEIQARQILIELGLRARLVGFNYLLSVLEFVVETEDTQPMQLHRKIYPEIAKFYNTTVAAVERGIRVAIRDAWGNESKEKVGQNQMFPEGKPRNKMFIKRIIESMNENQ